MPTASIKQRTSPPSINTSHNQNLGTDRSEAEVRQQDIEAAGTAPTQVVFRVTNWSAEPYTTKQHIVWALPPMPHPIPAGVGSPSRCSSVAQAHWPQLEPTPPAGTPARTGRLDVLRPRIHHCPMVFENGSWHRLVDTPVDDGADDANDDDDDDVVVDVAVVAGGAGRGL